MLKIQNLVFLILGEKYATKNIMQEKTSFKNPNRPIFK